jgi:hypothetical protein
LNITFIGAYILLTKYGSLTLSPGEKYTVNIPFIGSSKMPTICGTAEQTDGTLIKNVTVIVKYSNSNTTLAQNITGTNGKYCITLPEVNSSNNDNFDIYLQYDNITSTGEELVLGSNDYTLNFENNKVYNKSFDEYVFLTGNITNEDVRIENGRFEIKIGYREGTSGSFSYFGDYERYNININSNEIYSVPNEELNVSWKIPNDASTTGQYKFYFMTSFNGVEKTAQSVYFNITD